MQEHELVAVQLSVEKKNKQKGKKREEKKRKEISESIEFTQPIINWQDKIIIEFIEGKGLHSFEFGAFVEDAGR